MMRNNFRWSRPSSSKPAEALRAGKFADCLIRLENLLPNFPRVNVLPIIEKRVRHGTKFNVQVSQIQPGRVELPPGATLQLEAGELKPPRLRVFSQQDKLVAIAEALVPRTYQPIVVLRRSAGSTRRPRPTWAPPRGRSPTGS